MLKELLVSSLQFWCLSEALYSEARAQGYHEMVSVGVVIHNRVLDDRWPDSYCEVVDQPYQFSYRNGVTGRTPIHEPEAFEDAQKAALAVYTLDDRSYIGNILYFHSGRKPNWDFSKLEEYSTLDTVHTFYRDAR